MNRRDVTQLLALSVAAGLVGLPVAPQARATEGDPLPSWNDGERKKAIIDFVTRATTPGDGFIEPADRIAVFDNDGTLWCEQPMYVQLAFALDRVKALSADHPEWKTTEPFKSAIEGDFKALAAGGEKAIAQIVAASHTGNTTDEFLAIVKDWIGNAKHPRFDRLYTQCVYQPMLEVLAYLRANGFSTWIVSGGGIEFMRPWTEDVYGVPPAQVIGSSVKTRFDIRDGKPVILRLPEIDFIDDKAGKPIGINRFIGGKPVAAFGNSDGDFEMLEWNSATRPGALSMIVHHDDAEREYAYDRNSPIGHLERGLDEAKARGWHLISMKNDWKRIFPDA